MANITQENILINVQTYNESSLALLENQNCFIATANTEFDGFEDEIPKQLGSTVNFDLFPRMNTVNSLVISTQPAVQRLQPLTIDHQASTSYGFSATQFIFNARDYIKKWGNAAIGQIGAKIEADLASLAETNTYRFYNPGGSSITTSLQLATALEVFRNFGAINHSFKGYLSNLTYPQIVNSNLNQFTQKRNDEEAMSWEVGEFSGCEWYRSNLLPTHISGTVGQSGVTLTVLSTTLNADGSIAAITFSGAAANDASCVLAYDKFQFVDGVAGYNNVRFLTFIGGIVSEVPGQFAAMSTAASNSSGNVTVTLGTAAGPLPLYPGVPLSTQFGINTQIVPGMQCTVLPSHRCGLITSGNPLMAAFPKLPEVVPFPSSVAMDPETGVSIRQYYGSLFGQNQEIMVNDCIWGRTLVPENAMLLPLFI